MTAPTSTRWKTDDGVEIVEGLRVFTYDWKWATVLTDRGRSGNFAGWFDVQYDDGTTSMFNGPRMTTTPPNPGLADPHPAGVKPLPYKSQSARDAAERGYGSEHYWAYLDRAAQEGYDRYIRRGDPERAEWMMSRSLSEALRGNDGD